MSIWSLPPSIGSSFNNQYKTHAHKRSSVLHIHTHALLICLYNCVSCSHNVEHTGKPPMIQAVWCGCIAWEWRADGPNNSIYLWSLNSAAMHTLSTYANLFWTSTKSHILSFHWCILYLCFHDAMQCVNWRQHLICANNTWTSLSCFMWSWPCNFLYHGFSFSLPNYL